MTRTKTIVLCLSAVAAIIAVSASSASAALPELGRCVPVSGVTSGKHTVYSGAYTSKTCTRPSATHKGRYEWLPGAGEKNKFFATGLEPEPVLETVGGAKISCSSLTLKGGEFTGPKTAKVKTVSFAGCESQAVGCQTDPLKEGEIEGSEFTMELGTITKAAKPVVGWDLKKEGVAFTYSCGKLPEVRGVQMIEGSVIAPLSSGSEFDLNRMSKKALLKYKQKDGKQLPEAFEGGAKDTLTTTTITEGLSKTVEQTGLLNNLEIESGLGEAGIEKAENQEALEVKTIGEPAA